MCYYYIKGGLALKTKYDYIIGQRFGYIEPLEYIGRGKFRCLCHNCGNTEYINTSQHILAGECKSCGCLPRYKDITGTIVNEHIAEKFLYLKNKKAIWQWRCLLCGNVRESDMAHAKRFLCRCKQVQNKQDEYIGKRFGKLEVQSLAYIKNQQWYWHCVCQCGNTVDVSTYQLSSGNTKSCGCSKGKRGSSHPFFKDISGKTFGTLTALKPLGGRYWLFHCNLCGKNKPMVNADVTSGKCYSCGCMNLGIKGSKGENEIRKWVENLAESDSVKDRQILDGKEIDMYYPEFNIGIEYNGSAYHASLNGVYGDKPKLYHRDKFLQSKEQGIHLISIFDIDWENNQEKIKMYLRSLFTKQKRLFARKCKVKPISKELANSFTDMYHIQGRTRQNSINYGLYYNDELYAVMSFGTLRLKKTQDGEYELHRYCVKDGYTILGGAEKLLKYFERKYAPRYIRSYSDNDYFLGSIYERLGFENSGQCTPRYYWFLNNQEIKRERCMLKHLKVQYPELLAKAYETNAPNKENFVMVQLGARKVYRSGNTKWEKIYGR